jgi:hypothetical protein
MTTNSTSETGEKNECQKQLSTSESGKPVYHHAATLLEAEYYEGAGSKTEGRAVRSITMTIKFRIASHVSYVDKMAVELLEYSLREYAKTQKMTRKDLNAETPYLVDVSVTVQKPESPKEA